MNKISRDSAAQLNRILLFLPEDRKGKIPENIWKIINDKIDGSFDTKIYKVEDIKEENILPETRKYLSYIFLNYLSTEEEKEEYTKILKNNEEEYQKILSKKYNVDNIFRKTKILVDVEKRETELPVKVKENIFQKLVNKLKRIFLKNK